MQEINLTTAFYFTQNCFAQQWRAPFPDEGLDGQAAHRWGRNYGQITQTRQRHIQRTWYRCGGECQDINLGTQGLETFFLAGAKTVFFIDDDQAEALEFDTFLKKFVGAYDNIDLTRLDVMNDLLLLLLAAKT